MYILPQPYLSHEEEEELSTFVVNCAAVGYGKTRKQVLEIVQRLLYLKVE